MEVTKTQLKDMIFDMVNEMKSQGKPIDGAMSSTGVGDFETSQDVAGLGMDYNNVQNNIVRTMNGSIIDKGNPSNPWLKLGPEMEEFARGFKALCNDKPVTRLLQENTDPSGGYLVPEEFLAQIVQYKTAPAIVWPRATIWPMATDKLGFPKLAQRPDEDAADHDHFASISWVWTEEGVSKTETQPEFEFMELIAHELSGFTQITDIMLEDSPINLINFLTGLFRDSYLWTTDRSFIRSNGARSPLGVCQDPAVLTVARQTAGAFTYADALAMSSKLPSVFDDGAVFFMSKKAANSLRGQVDSNGAPVLQQWYSPILPGVGGGVLMTLLGYPVIFSCGKTYPVGTKGDVILGNWKHFAIGDRRRFTFDTSKHYAFIQNRTTIRCTGRVDSIPMIPEAFVLLSDVEGES